MSDIRETLKERGERYGQFPDHASYAQTLKDACRESPGFKASKPFQREALEMILHKVARICNGDPDYDDSWRDIAGYAQLVVDELNRDDIPV